MYEYQGEKSNRDMVYNYLVKSNHTFFKAKTICRKLNTTQGKVANGLRALHEEGGIIERCSSSNTSCLWKFLKWKTL